MRAPSNPLFRFLRRSSLALVAGLMMVLFAGPAQAGTATYGADQEGLAKLAKDLPGNAELLRSLKPNMAEVLELAAGTSEAVRIYVHTERMFRSLPEGGLEPRAGWTHIKTHVVPRHDEEGASAKLPYIAATRLIDPRVGMHAIDYVGAEAADRTTFASFFHVGGRWVMVPLIKNVSLKPAKHDVEEFFFSLLKEGLFEDAYAMMSERVHETVPFADAVRTFKALFPSQLRGVRWGGHLWRGGRYGKSQVEQKGTLVYQGGVEDAVVVGTVMEQGRTRIAYVERRSKIGVPLTVAVTPSRAASLELFTRALKQVNAYFVSGDFARLEPHLTGLDDATLREAFAEYFETGLDLPSLEKATFALIEEPRIERDDTPQEHLRVRARVEIPSAKRFFTATVQFKYDKFKERFLIAGLLLGHVTYLPAADAAPQVDAAAAKALAQAQADAFKAAIQSGSGSDWRAMWSPLLRRAVTAQDTEAFISEALAQPWGRAVTSGDPLEVRKHHYPRPGALIIEAHQHVELGRPLTWTLEFVFEADGTWKLVAYNVRFADAK